MREGRGRCRAWVLLRQNVFFPRSLPHRCNIFIKEGACCGTLNSASALFKPPERLLWCNFLKCLICQIQQRQSKKKNHLWELETVVSYKEWPQPDCSCFLAWRMSTVAQTRKTVASVSRWGCSLCCEVLHCRQAPYLLKQHMSFTGRPSSTHTINLILLCIARHKARVWKHPVSLWASFILSVEEMCDILIYFFYPQCNRLLNNVESNHWS